MSLKYMFSELRKEVDYFLSPPCSHCFHPFNEKAETEWRRCCDCGRMEQLEMVKLPSDEHGPYRDDAKTKPVWEHRPPGFLG